MWERVSKFLLLKSNSIITDIMCVVYKDEKDAYKWIELKHTGENEGKGTVPWDVESKRRFDLKKSGIKPISIQIIDFVNESSEFNELQKNKLKDISITNLERLIGDPHIREAIGFKLKNGILKKVYSDSELARGINKIIDDLSKKDFSVKEIYTKKQRLDYISKFEDKDLPNLNKKLEEEVSINNDTEKTIVENNIHLVSSKEKNENEDSSSINSTSYKIPEKESDKNKEVKISRSVKDKKFSYDRKYLIPTSIVIKISNSRINDIYKELKFLEVDKFTNAVAVLFRVFIELSLDEYFVRYPNKDINSDSKLNKKLQYCLNSLKSKNLINEHEARPLNTAISSPNSIFSISTFNGYVHNKDWYPSANELKISWNNFEKFIYILWNTL